MLSGLARWTAWQVAEASPSYVGALGWRVEAKAVAVVIRAHAQPRVVRRLAVRHGLTPVAILYRDGVAARIDHLGPPAQIVGRTACSQQRSRQRRGNGRETKPTVAAALTAVELQACKVVLHQRLDALCDGEVEERFVSEVVLGAVAVVEI